MSEEVYNELRAQLNEVQRKIEALPESVNNGLLIDAVQYAKSSQEHLRRYFMLKQKAR